MQAKWLTRFGLLGASVVASLLACWVTSQTALPHLAVGAEVTGSGWFAELASVISASGLTLATVIAFLKKWEPVAEPLIRQVLPDVRLPDLNNPATEKTIVDTAEIAMAVIAFLQNRNDKKAQRRFATAVLTELSDLAELKSPEIADALSKLSAAVVARWFPAPPAQETPS